jgi:flagellar FliJ protein
MNRRLAQLVQLLGIKKEATRNAYIAVIKAKEKFEQHKIRHDQLAGYRQDYIHQMESLGKDGTSMDRLRNRIYFINQLDTALSQLTGVLAQLAKGRTKAELEYKQAKVAEEAVIKLIERAKKDEELKQQRLEQKQIDEYAQKQWYGKKNNE